MSVSTNRVSDPDQSPVEAYQGAVEIGAEAAEASSPFIGKWRTLVSTTNWEKGRIVCQWREQLEKAGASAAEYSDEAWAQLVGGVTGQHVGRLRRVYTRFGEVYPEYEGLYWSHFQAACEWDDAEMWLEGAVQNGWSVSQTRAQRWETVGEGKPDPDAGRAATDELMEEGPTAIEPVARGAERTSIREAADEDDEEVDEAAPSGGSSAEEAGLADDYDSPAAEGAEPPHRPFAELPELPDDVADAFEQFKLVILNHKLAGWADVSRADILASLDALKQLAMAPSDDE